MDKFVIDNVCLFCSDATSYTTTGRINQMRESLRKLLSEDGKPPETAEKTLPLRLSAAADMAAVLDEAADKLGADFPECAKRCRKFAESLVSALSVSW